LKKDAEGYSSNSHKATSRTLCINAFLTPEEFPTNTTETKLFNKACGTVHLLTTMTGNLAILDITIANNNITMPACLINFCVNAKVTCMLDAYWALAVVRHTHFWCDAIKTQHFKEKCA
jgi:hypothetical protein